MTTNDARREAPGAVGVLTLSTISFPLMFAVWLMFGILGVPIQEEFGLTNPQLFWISALAVLNGSMWRLPAGMIADRVGGKVVMVTLLLVGAAASIAVANAQNYPMLLALAFVVGLVGNSFSVGVAWNSAWFTDRRKGLALGIFGAGNVGASVTKLIGPGIIAATAGSTYVLGIRGGWRLIPVIYAVLLVVMAVLTVLLVPREDRKPASAMSIGAMLEPLKELRVWRFSYYYVIVFGAYVAFSAYLPSYYVQNFDVSLGAAAAFTATFIFPASLLRPLGGWVSDQWGARKAMYLTFTVMLAATGVLSIPTLDVWTFAVLVFVVGCAMGIGKAAVYKHIPNYFPNHVGSVGGLVGMLGGLGGFFLPIMFSYAQDGTGRWSTAWFILFMFTAIAMVWMHLTIRGMQRRGGALHPDHV